VNRSVLLIIGLLFVAVAANAALIATPNATSFPARPGIYDAALTVTTSDANTYSVPVAIYVGGTGNVTVTPSSGGADVVFTAVPAGAILPLRVTAVKATGTTATLMIALY
jgi:hypothetical protein